MGATAVRQILGAVIAVVLSVVLAVVLASPAAARPPAGTPAADGLVGFASVDALGQNGTTGGAGGTVVTVTTAAQFLDYISRAGRYVIQVSGTITLPTGSTDGMHDVTSPPANAVHHIIVRNLSISGATDDLLNVQMFSHHIWIDHNDFSNGDDGAVDIKRGSGSPTTTTSSTVRTSAIRGCASPSPSTCSTTTTATSATASPRPWTRASSPRETTSTR